MSTFDKIIEPAVPFIRENQDLLPGDQEKCILSFTAFITNMLFGIFSKIKSVRQMITEIETSPAARSIGLVKASRSMYSEAFTRYRPELFKNIFISLLKSCNFMEIPEIKHLGKIFLIDGSVFPAVMKMEWAEYKKGFNALKFHLSFNLNFMIPADFLVTEGKFSERNFLAHVVKRGITYICDRGYVSFDIFRHISESEAFFIIRGKENMKYSEIKRMETNIPDVLSAILKNVTDSKIIFTNDKNQIMYRIIKFIIDGEKYTLATNRFDLSSYEIIMLYAYRWQVELCFRFLKRTFNGIHLFSHSPQGVQVQFYLFMIGYILLIYFKQLSEKSCASEKEEEECPHVAENKEDLSTPDVSGKTYACGLVSMLGEKLKKFWKISLSWLTSIKNFLAEPFSKKIFRYLNGVT